LSETKAHKKAKNYNVLNSLVNVHLCLLVMSWKLLWFLQAEMML